MDVVRAKYIKEWISQLPTGNISYKTIRGKRYPYYQWNDNGKQRSRVVKPEEFDELSEKIEQRKVLEKKLSESNVPAELLEPTNYFSDVLIGLDLLKLVEKTKEYKKRNCYSQLYDYVYGDSTDRVFILYGLRRSGKSTLIKQLIADMPHDMFLKSAFMQVGDKIKLSEINMDLKQLSKQGYEYIFIDEVTEMKDFIDGAALFSDIYASRGLKIVLSGTDSLGFMFTQDRELYDRCDMLHTTFIPYREFAEVLNVGGIDTYIQYGGTMTLGGTNYNLTNTTFANKKTTNEYIDSAIANNIQHSLTKYKDGDHFRHLRALYDAGELTSVINRIVEYENNQFTVKVLTKFFKSGDLHKTSNNLLKDKNNEYYSNLFQLVDMDQINEWFRRALDIYNRDEMTVPITEGHVAEIREYLKLLDLTVDIDVVNMSNLSKKETHTAISQPGMRYAQAKALVESLAKDEVFATFSLADRNYISERLMTTIKGTMLEDIILLETKIARPECEVFKLKFAVGEFDMVIFNPETSTCEIFEIKHSTETHPNQYQHISSEEKCKSTEFRYGNITGKYVIYRGESKVIDGIQYVKAEEYLNSL